MPPEQVCCFVAGIVPEALFFSHPSEGQYSVLLFLSYKDGQTKDLFMGVTR